MLTTKFESCTYGGIFPFTIRFFRDACHLWRKVSLAVNPDIRLFDDGTDPDDVRRGAFADSWLLSALSIISAATIGDGGVDEQVYCHQIALLPSQSLPVTAW